MLIPNLSPNSNLVIDDTSYHNIQTDKPTSNFVTDQLFAQKGHIVLRLSPYDPDLNPIELIWADVKQLVAS
jgi:transposase